jgi:hypothetical protein
MFTLLYLAVGVLTALALYRVAGDRKLFGIGGVPLFAFLGLIWPLTLILTALANLEVLVKRNDR